MSNTIPVEYRAILLGDDACAEAVFYAIGKILGPAFTGWEPETIRLELLQRKVEIRPENFEAVMAVMALRSSTDFYWDANVFDDICCALNGEMPDFTDDIPLSPAQIAWAVEQAHRITGSSPEHNIPEELSLDDRFDYEPITYTAAVCRDAGMVTAPGPLSFCRSRLECYTCSDCDFVAEVKKAWNALDHETLEQHPFSEDAVGVQLALMATVPVYLRERRRSLASQLRLLSGANQSSPSSAGGTGDP